MNNEGLSLEDFGICGGSPYFHRCFFYPPGHDIDHGLAPRSSLDILEVQFLFPSEWLMHDVLSAECSGAAFDGSSATLKMCLVNQTFRCHAQGIPMAASSVSSQSGNL